METGDLGLAVTRGKVEGGSDEGCERERERGEEGGVGQVLYCREKIGRGSY